MQTLVLKYKSISSMIIATVVLLIQATALLFLGGAIFREGNRMIDGMEKFADLLECGSCRGPPLHHLTWDWWCGCLC